MSRDNVLPNRVFVNHILHHLSVKVKPLEEENIYTLFHIVTFP